MLWRSVNSFFHRCHSCDLRHMNVAGEICRRYEQSCHMCNLCPIFYAYAWASGVILGLMERRSNGIGERPRRRCAEAGKAVRRRCEVPEEIAKEVKEMTVVQDSPVVCRILVRTTSRKPIGKSEQSWGEGRGRTRGRTSPVLPCSRHAPSCARGGRRCVMRRIGSVRWWHDGHWRGCVGRHPGGSADRARV